MRNFGRDQDMQRILPQLKTDLHKTTLSCRCRLDDCITASRKERHAWRL